MSRNKRGQRKPDRHRQGPTPAAASKLDQTPPGKRRWLLFLVLAAVVIGAGGLGFRAWKTTRQSPVVASAAPPSSAASMAAASFVGAKACAGCHASEHAEWQKSQHAKAMQHATEATVLGDFNDARFTYAGIESTFFRRDGKFYVNTDGADGKLADFEITHTFGVYPLQQYLVAFPDGRRQALSIVWDARPKAQGGGRWYHLYPDDRITHGDPLHWTRLNQNWNWMCADCHTTRFDRNYNAANNSYDSKWSEMNVACEACHGPGSNHVAWAKRDPGSEKLAAHHGLVVALDERNGVHWLPDRTTGSAARSVPLASRRELGVCAQCHSRRAPFADGMDHGGRLLDTHDIALLSEGLYEVDGQQRDEVYNVGSFLQSRMHARGVTCSDCHNPHSGQLRAPGNAVCAQCHSPATFDTPAHTLHARDSAGAQCAACHMPTRAYMGIDPRHDHSIRIPRPDLSVKLETPNACTSCHKDRTAAWAASAIERAFGPERKGFQNFGAALHDSRTGAPDAARGLMALANDPQAPAIARATALSDLRRHLSATVMPALEAGLADPDPMVRGAALDTLLAAPPSERVRLAASLIDDPSRIVRIKAARVLAVAPDDGMDGAMRGRLEKVFGEYVDSQRANADRPESHVNLGLFYFERGDLQQSETEYRAAVALEPDFVPAYVNLADLYRRQDREKDAEAVLEAGLQKASADPDLSHALGLLRVRQGRAHEALPLLGQAARSRPDNARYAYVYGVALHDLGQGRQGMAVLEQALKRFPDSPELLNALAEYARDAGDTRRADAYAKRLAEIVPPAPAHAKPHPGATRIE